MSDYDDIPHGSDMPNGSNMPPAEAEGLDRPDELEDGLDDTANEFNEDPPATTLDPTEQDDPPLDDSDDESLLSEVDEAQFDDFDPSAVAVAPDFDDLRKTKINKRKREDGDAMQPRKKEKTRERVRRRRGAEEEVDGVELDGTAAAATGTRKRKTVADGERRRREHVEVDEDTLTPEERRRRALDRAIDAAVKKSSGKRLRKGEIDLEAAADEEIASLRNRMTTAAIADGDLVREGKPAYQKLKLLPEVVSTLTRNTYQQSILDPETNLLEAVRFFLEPLSDGSLPAYNIQRELFQALEKLPMTKEALISSGIGKVIFFYRKSKRVDAKIKRQATKLMEEWSRPILQRSDDFTKKNWETAVYDPTASARKAMLAAGAVGGSGASQSVMATAAIRRKDAAVAPGQKVSNRAQAQRGATSYTIVPQMGVLPRR